MAYQKSRSNNRRNSRRNRNGQSNSSNQQKNKPNREERAKQAETHTKRMAAIFASDIRKSVDGTKCYTSDMMTDLKHEPNPDMHVGTIALGTAQAASKLAQYGGKTALLDFASFKNPGGGYLNGSFAQEEAICSESNLYNILSQMTDWYDENRSMRADDESSNALYADRGLYVPDVALTVNSRIVKCDVIVVAAPNWGAASKAGCDKAANDEALSSRIDLVLDMAEDNGVKSIVLGAFGCGVFGQDPKQVARMFKEKLANRPFANVVFAVLPGRGGDVRNVKAFLNEFGEIRI